MIRRGWIVPSLLIVSVIGIGVALATWKYLSIEKSIAAAANQPEPADAVTIAVAAPREHRRMTTSIGTVMALRSITLKNELAGTVSRVNLEAGEIVNEGTILVALDVTVEEAELKAQEAQASLAESLLARARKANQSGAIAEEGLDRARAEREVALAQIERTKAVIARKTIRAPFRARVGISDVHKGQYLAEGTQITTLQGIDPSAHVDFTVAQHVAAVLQVGDKVEVIAANAAAPLPAKIVAVDARVDPVTRNAMVRARIENGDQRPSPGASVRVRIPVGDPQTAIAIPASALRKGPAGDHVFIIVTDKDGKHRSHARTVKSGALLGDDVLILEGLVAGEKVAASGSFKLREGALVSIAKEPAAAKKK